MVKNMSKQTNGDFPMESIITKINLEEKMAKRVLLICSRQKSYHEYVWPRGLMDKASDFGSEDCRFESCRGRNFSFLF